MFYLFGKELSLANARAFHENPDRIYTAQIYKPLKRELSFSNAFIIKLTIWQD